VGTGLGRTSLYEAVVDTRRSIINNALVANSRWRLCVAVTRGYKRLVMLTNTHHTLNSIEPK
jgi:hypothetical protein